MWPKIFATIWVVVVVCSVLYYIYLIGYSRGWSKCLNDTHGPAWNAGALNALDRYRDLPGPEKEIFYKYISEKSGGFVSADMKALDDLVQRRINLDGERIG